LQNQERDILRQMYKLQPEPTKTQPKLTQTDHLIDNYKGQFEELQRKNNRLERERRSKHIVFILYK
jgi:hypothetical protein